jgi:mercuric reductase
MNTKVQTAVDRLNKILPLAQRQKTLDHEINNIYQRILRSYVELGRTLNKAEIAKYVSNIDDTINTLRSNDMVVFNTSDEPVGAYPFTMEQRDHKININNHIVHAMCALDALAISPMFKLETHIDSVCHVTGTAISIDQFDQEILNRDKNANLHFGIDWNSAANNCCATSLCTEMIFLIDEDIAHAWLTENPEAREIFTIDVAIDFASQFFRPLIS